MKIAVMQPYFFPYIGYFQLLNSVDKFVFYDDVNFIKQGWVNRNRILVNGQDQYITIPLLKASPNRLINDIEIGPLRERVLKTITMAYKKAPFFEDVISVIESVFTQEIGLISDFAISSVITVSKYLNLSTQFVVSSEAYSTTKGLERQERLINICKQEKSSHYINALGGQELYKKDDFSNEGIKLDFIKSLPLAYKQFNNDFVPWLSIIDVLMFNSKEEIAEILNKYELV